MAISNNLSKKVEADVKGSQEIAIESQVKNTLSEIKNKFKYTDSYLSTLYDSGFQTYLRGKTFESAQTTEINKIKQKIIRQGLENKKLAEHSSKWGPKLYRIAGISKDIHNNSTTQNVIKGVIDELMAIPDMITHIIDIGIFNFGKALWKLIKNPNDLRKGLKQAYGDAFTQGLSTPEGAYRKGRSAALIVLTLMPGGATKFGLNLTRGVRRTISKQATKVGLKNSSKEVSKSVATKAEKGLKNTKGGRTMYREMNGGARNYAQRQVEKNSDKITRESQAATNAGRVAEMPARTPGIIRGRVDKNLRLLGKLPVIKQINSITRRTFKKLDKLTEAALRKFHPKFYEKLMQQQNRLSIIRNQAKGWAEQLGKQKTSIQKATKEIEKQEAKIAEINQRIALRGRGWGLDKLNLIKAQEKLARLKSDLNKLMTHEGILKNKLMGANEAYLVHQSILEGMNKAQRAGKLAIWIETQQVASILDRSEIATLDREIKETIAKIEDISKELEDGLKEIDDLLKEYEGTYDGLGTGQTEFIEDNISIDLPNGIDLSKIDTNTYKIVITGLASKTGSRSVNERIARQRAENTKKILMDKYGIKDEGQITIQIDLQSNHPDKMSEDVSKWQGARVKIEPKNSPTNKATSYDNKSNQEEEDADAALDAALENI